MQGSTHILSTIPPVKGTATDPVSLHLLTRLPKA